MLGGMGCLRVAGARGRRAANACLRDGSYHLHLTEHRLSNSPLFGDRTTASGDRTTASPAGILSLSPPDSDAHNRRMHLSWCNEADWKDVPASLQARGRCPSLRPGIVGIGAASVLDCMTSATDDYDAGCPHADGNVLQGPPPSSGEQ